MSSAHTTLTPDIAILGGGIAGLWLLNRLVNAGYDAILFETRALGTGQTVASQGMIHGGIKYTLAGTLTGASEAIAQMPERWRACLQGKGDVSLTDTQILSDHFYLWSPGSSLASSFTAFVASKTLRGRVDKLDAAQHPEIFQHDEFNGTVYKLVDLVLDTPSLLENLAHNMSGRCFEVTPAQLQLLRYERQASLTLQHEDQHYIITPRCVILAAGEGNQVLLDTLGATSPVTQLRPLRQVLVKHHNAAPFFGHCSGSDSKPRLTISTHRCTDGSMVWYLGGALAENGAHLSDAALIALAQQELQTLFPWLHWEDAQWTTLAVNRAEPRQANLARPDNAFIEPADSVDNVLVAWPTKLTLVPDLADRCITTLLQQQVLPRPHNKNAVCQISEASKTLAFLPTPTVAAAPWETLFMSGDDSA